MTAARSSGFSHQLRGGAVVGEGVTGFEQVLVGIAEHPQPSFEHMHRLDTQVPKGPRPVAIAGRHHGADHLQVGVARRAEQFAHEAGEVLVGRQWRKLRSEVPAFAGMTEKVLIRDLSTVGRTL